MKKTKDKLIFRIGGFLSYDDLVTLLEAARVALDDPPTLVWLAGILDVNDDELEGLLGRLNKVMK